MGNTTLIARKLSTGTPDVNDMVDGEKIIVQDTETEYTRIDGKLIKTSEGPVDVTTNAFLNISTTYTVLNSNGVINCGDGTYDVTLPTAVGITGRQYTIKNSGLGTITVQTNGSETIDLASSLAIAALECYTVLSDGTNWIIINSHN